MDSLLFFWICKLIIVGAILLRVVVSNRNFMKACLLFFFQSFFIEINKICPCNSVLYHGLHNLGIIFFKDQCHF